jgi:flagellum-specific ATP synthase
MTTALDRVAALRARVATRSFDAAFPEPRRIGRLTRIVGLTMEASGCALTVGARCEVQSNHGALEAEVVGFHGERTLLMPFGDITGLEPGARVIPLADPGLVPDVEQLCGRVLDGLGRPIDGGPPLAWHSHVPQKVHALARAPIHEHMDTGVRAINALLTVGRGQRMGLFAGSGVGKSVLLGMMSRYTSSDINVVALIGERGREVREFLDDNLGPEGLARSVVIAAPADDPPLLRLKAAELALTLAEVLRDRGDQVLLMMDSLTRYAQAHREIALAGGEPPATRGYTPSVFARIPKLVERAGNGAEGGGSITAFFTVLTEGDDPQDPVADSARAILDGHILLDRRLADEGHYPAIDIESSISRVMARVTTPQQQEMARTLKRLYSRYKRNEDLISIGAYVAGSDADTDRAIKLMPKIRAFLQQRTDERCGFEQCLRELGALVLAPAG